MKILAATLLLAAFAVRAEPQTLRFYGYAYDLQSGKYLYTEVYRENVQNGRWISGHTSYYDAGGHRLGEKTLSFAADPYVPLYDLSLPSAGYAEGITEVGAGQVRLFKQTAEKGRQDGSVPRAEVLAAVQDLAATASTSPSVAA